MLPSAVYSCIGSRRFCEPAVLLGLAVCLSVAVSGCSRGWYRERADEDAFEILDQKSTQPEWTPPDRFSIDPSSESRLYDPSPVTEPTLPNPTPGLYEYSIPEGIGRRAGHAGRAEAVSRVGQWQPTAAVLQAHLSDEGHSTEAIVLTGLLAQIEGLEPLPPFEIEPVTVPPEAWETIPEQCLVRMFEFESVRDEYEVSHGEAPPESDFDTAPRVDLDDIIELGLLNSREYQSQKESLYRVALRLSLQRFDYELKASPFGNSTGASFGRQRTDGSSFGQLQIPNGLRADVLLNTGSTLVTRFANDVILTFGGPDGFAADVGSELLFELTHSFLQNDVRFERLTQAERNVVYAARDFMRFRRSFYLQLATQYYNLLLSYRRVEINALNYLTLAQLFAQRQVELSQDNASRLETDQFEQNVLAGRSSLIGTCNGLENAIDRLKILLGLPTESPLNINLDEVHQLTRQDELGVSLELVRRTQSRLEDEGRREEINEARLLHGAAELVSRIRDLLELQQKPLPGSSQSSPARALPPELTGPQVLSDLSRQVSRLQVAEARLLASQIRQRIEIDAADPDTSSIRVPTLSLEFARSVLDQISEELLWMKLLGASQAALQPIDDSARSLITELKESETLSDEVLAKVTADGLVALRNRTDMLLAAADAAAQHSREAANALARENGIDPTTPTANLVATVLRQSNLLRDASQYELPEIHLETDAALLAGLSRRLDLMNARGFLADEWRGIKLRADDLKSILNLSVQQRLFTENQSDGTADLDLDQSRTDVAITLDAPLNRRAQRNAFREQLLNYQVSRRSLMALEDRIKQSIRIDLRALSLAEEQHALGIASSAVAHERVTSAELRLRLGVPNTRARDFLEAQTAYAQALTQVATTRIGHILSRIGLFVDMEQLQLDDNSRWPGINDDSLLPDVELPDTLLLNYDDLPPDIQYSDEMLRGLGNW